MLDFLGIGAQKAGTTWLYAQLASHPRIRFPHGKEVHYWDWVQAGRRPAEIEWYCELFAGDDGRVKGEITPAYALLEEPYIRQIHALNPALRLLFILRNPIERAWSAALMELARAGLRREEVGDRWFIEVFRSPQSLARGDYEATLRRWGRVFQESQLLLLDYADLLRNPRRLLAEAANHLGVDGGFFDRLPEADLRRKVRPDIGFQASQPPLTEPLADELRRLYADKIASLGRYLGRDLSAWLEAPEGPPDDSAAGAEVVRVRVGLPRQGRDACMAGTAEGG